MDRIFLAGLKVAADSPKGSPVGTPGLDRRHGSPTPSPKQLNAAASMYGSPLYSSGTAPAAVPASPTNGLATSPLIAGINGVVLCSLYGGHPPEQLLFDAATCDLVMLVTPDDPAQTTARPIPVHKEVLRARNPGGYFARLLADPAAFPEYSEPGGGSCGGMGSGSTMAALTGPLAGRPVVRRTQWSYSLACALLTFLYRDACEAPWGQLPALRAAAEEVGLRSLVDCIDALLDPQHLLPWTAADLRSAGAACGRAGLVEAAERYMAACRAAGVDKTTRMASFIYHARQARPRFAHSSAAPRAMDAPASPSRPSGLQPSLSFSLGRNSAPLTASDGPWFASAATPPAAPGSPLRPSSSSIRASSGPHASSGASAAPPSAATWRDMRMGVDLLEGGLLRSVAIDSKTLRALLLPGRRKEYVTLSGAGAGAEGGAGRQRRQSGYMGYGDDATDGALGGKGGGWHSSPQLCGSTAGAAAPRVSVSVFNHSRPASPGGASGPGGGGGSGGSSRSTTPTGAGAGPGGPGSSRLGRGSFELPILGAVGGGGRGRAGTGAGAGGADTAGERGTEPPESVALLVVVPAAQLPACLAAALERGLEDRGPRPLPTGAPGHGLACKDGLTALDAAASASPGPQQPWSAAAATAPASGGGGGPGFQPFSRLAGAPGLQWDRPGTASSFAGGAGGMAPPSPTLRAFASFSSTTSGPASSTLARASSPHAPPPPSPLPSPPPGWQLPPPTAASFQRDRLTLALGLDADPTTAVRLLGAVLAALAAGEGQGFAVRMDATSAAAALAAERRRAAMDSLAPLHGLLGLAGAGSGGLHGGPAAGCRGVVGPANPRDFYLPLPAQPGCALALSLPLGLLLADPAQMEAAAAGGSTAGPCAGAGSGSITGAGERWLAAAAESSGGPGGGIASTRASALLPGLLSSGAALAGLCGCVGAALQVLRVAAEQHGLFALPHLRACLRVEAPSAAMMQLLCQTNTYFAIEPHASTLYIRKPPGDIVRLLQAIHSTLPMRTRSSNGSLALGDGGHPHPQPHHPHHHWLHSTPDLGLSVLTRSPTPLGGHGPSRASLDHGHGHSPMRGPMRASLDMQRHAAAGAAAAGPGRPGTPSGGHGGSRPGTPLGGGRPRGSLDLVRPGAGGASASAIPSLCGGGQPGSRASLDAGGRAAVGAGGGLGSVAMGLPYGQLERLFPGWHMHVVELTPGVPVEEF